MSTTADTPIPDDEPSGPGPSPTDGNAGVQIGMSEEAGGTFEPEEDPATDD